MEQHTTLTSKQLRTRLGGYLIDLKYRKDHVFLVGKSGEDDFSAVLCSPQLLREKGIAIPTRPPKADDKAKADAKSKKKK